jgi:hypothetical protein
MNLSSNCKSDRGLIMHLERNGQLFSQAFFNCAPDIRLFEINRYIVD